MAVPAYATDLVDITTSFSTNWNLISEGGGGQNSLTAPETDDLIQGTECVSRNPFSSSIRGVAYDRATIAVAAGDAVYHWWKADVAAALDSFANGGVHIIHGPSLTAYKKYYVAGNDNYQKGGWRCSPIDPTAASSLDRGTPGSPNYSTFGVAFDIPASGPSKGFPFKADMIRHGREVRVTAGEVANPASWVATAQYADATTRRWGIIQETDTGASLQGIIQWGTATASVYSRESNVAVVLDDTLGFTATDFTQIQFLHASNDIEWDNVGVKALGTLNRGIISVTANGTIKWTNSVFEGIDTTTLMSGCTFDGSKWIGTNAVTAPGASLLNAKILAPTVAADTSALVWDVNTDTSGKLDGMEFTKGANAHHGLELGLNSPLTISLSGVTESGFNAANGQNDSFLHVKRTAGTVTVNLVDGCVGNFSYKTDGATVVVQQSNSLTIKGALNGGSLTIFDDETADGANLNTVLQGPTATDGTDVTYSHGFTSNDIVVQFYINGYEEINVNFSLTNAPQSLDLSTLLKPEVNI